MLCLGPPLWGRGRSNFAARSPADFFFASSICAEAARRNVAEMTGPRIVRTGLTTQKPAGEAVSRTLRGLSTSSLRQPPPQRVHLRPLLQRLLPPSSSSWMGRGLLSVGPGPIRGSEGRGTGPGRGHGPRRVRAGLRRRSDGGRRRSVRRSAGRRTGAGGTRRGASTTRARRTRSPTARRRSGAGGISPLRGAARAGSAMPRTSKSRVLT